jgi:hypothetical protein
MAIEGNTTCAMPGCGAHISGPNNLCYDHRLPGMGVRVAGSNSASKFNEQVEPPETR